MDIVALCLQKTVVTKFTSGKKPIELEMSLRKETFEIVCYTTTSRKSLEASGNSSSVKRKTHLFTIYLKQYYFT